MKQSLARSAWLVHSLSCARRMRDNNNDVSDEIPTHTSVSTSTQSWAVAAASCGSDCDCDSGRGRKRCKEPHKTQLAPHILALLTQRHTPPHTHTHTHSLRILHSGWANALAIGCCAASAGIAAFLLGFCCCYQRTFQPPCRFQLLPLITATKWQRNTSKANEDDPIFFFW